jgi:hypothetical protein
MAHKKDEALMKTLRDNGVRKKVARAISQADGKSDRARSALIDRTVDNLRTAASKLEDRRDGSRRSEAANYAAPTRKRNAAERRAATRNAANARSGSPS